MILMKRNRTWKTIITGLLAASCIGMALAGCGTEEKAPDGQIIESTVQPSAPAPDDTAANETIPDTPADNEPQISESEVNAPDIQNKIPAETADAQQTQTASAAQSLYEQFLNNDIPAVVSNDYPESDYSTPIFERGSSYTLTELGECISKYFLDPEYMTKTSYDYIQYAYVECPDSTDSNAKNLLVKFVGLNIYSQNDDSYAVFVITENNGQLYLTDWYECWARSMTTANANGTLGNFGSAGAGDSYDELSVILSNGKIAPVYSTEILYGWWTSYLNDAIYNEIFDADTEPAFIVFIDTVGEEKYYQYDLSECPEETVGLCMNYIDRCREEQGIRWVTEDDVTAAVKNQCSFLGIDYSITQQQTEAVWNNL